MTGKPNRLVLFDFDGTLTTRDSLFAFLRFYKGNRYFLARLVFALPMLLAYKLGLLNNSQAKEKLISIFLKGDDLAEFRERCRLFGETWIPGFLDGQLFSHFQQHLDQGDQVLIVSASLEDWIKPWAEKWPVEVLGTRIASRDGKLTGRFGGQNCNGEEKARRIRAHLSLSDYDHITAYGDTRGDEAMFSLADTVIYRGVKRDAPASE